MRLLLDTHTFLWFIEGNPQLNGHARQLIEDIGNEMIGRIAGPDTAMVQKILRNEPVDLPLHLLNAADFQTSGPEAR